MATERYYSKVLSLPHSSTFFCLICHPAIVFVLFVVRSFVLSFSLHIRPCSLLPLLPLFFVCCCCFFCASPFSSCFPCFSLLFVRALCLFFCCFLLYCSAITESLLYVRQLHERQRHNQDLHRQNQGRRSGGQGLGQPPIPPLLLQAAVTRHHRQHPRHKKKTRSSEPPTSKSRPSRPRSSRTPSTTFKVRRILLSL